MNKNAFAFMYRQIQKPVIPGAAIRSGRDYPRSQALRNHPDLPVLEFRAYDLPFGHIPSANGAAIGSGGIPTSAGMLGTLRFQVADHQACFLINPADPAITKCLAAWRSAGKVGIAWDIGDNYVVMLPEVDQTFACQIEATALTDSMSMADFVEEAFGLISAGTWEAQATSDLASHPTLRSATAYLVITKDVDKEAKPLAEKLFD